MASVFYSVAHVQLLVFILGVGVYGIISCFAHLCAILAVTLYGLGIQVLCLGVGIGINFAVVAIVRAKNKTSPDIRLGNVFGLFLLAVDVLLLIAIPLIFLHGD